MWGGQSWLQAGLPAGLSPLEAGLQGVLGMSSSLEV